MTTVEEARSEYAKRNGISEATADLLVGGYEAAKRNGRLADYMIALNKTPNGGYSDADIAAARAGS